MPAKPKAKKVSKKKVSKKTVARRGSRTNLTDTLNLEVAWARLKLDRPSRCFVLHPHVLEWIESDTAGWLRQLGISLGDSYTPHDCALCNSPKDGWLVRPGAILDYADEVVFNAVVAHFHPSIWNALSRSQGDPDIAYQLRSPDAGNSWIRSGFPVWREWREKSLQKCTRRIRYVVFADVAAFYENIDLSRVRSDLAALTGDSNVLELLMTCLHRWAQPRGRGIPQGYSASDILAKLYMNPLDQGLQSAGFTHLRYVDDIRIFCRTNLEAKRSLLLLSELLRTRGLNLQAAKTEIARVDDAKRKIDGVTPVIENIHSQLKEELRELDPDAASYATLEDIERIVAGDPNSPPRAVLEEAFEEVFGASSGQLFDKTLFHYLLRRLGKAKSPIAVDYCLDLLSTRPEETEHVLRYLSHLELTSDQVDVIVEYAASHAAIYDYQLYQIARWFYERSAFPADLVGLCRRWAFDRNRTSWLRAYALAILGETGNPADLEQVENLYTTASSDYEKAHIVAALTRMETGRRNAFFGRVRCDGELVRRAVARVRQQRR